MAAQRAAREMTTLVPRRNALPLGVSPAATTRAFALDAATMRATMPMRVQMIARMNTRSWYRCG